MINMSDFVSAFGSVNPSIMQKLQEKADMSDMTDELLAKKKEEIDRNTIDSAWKSIQRRKIRACYKLSIWSGDEEIKFKFDDWDVNKQADVEKARAVGNQAYKLTQELMTDNFNVTLYGNSGVGKTSLAIAMMTKLRDEADKSIMVVSTAELVSLLDNKYTQDDTRERLIDIEKALKEVDVLLLDDFGTEGGAINALKPVRKDMQDYLYRVANSRISGDKTTIITTNNTDDQLKQMYNAKTISRLMTKNKDHMIFFTNMEDVREV